MKIFNLTRKTLIAENAQIADTFSSRMIGLLNRESLGPEEALVITECQSIHMVFMKFPIDVIFVDGSNQVVGLVKEIKPFCFSPIFFKASKAIELPVQSIEKSQTQFGDSLQILRD